MWGKQYYNYTPIQHIRRLEDKVVVKSISAIAHARKWKIPT